jgi:hypothetical protein
MSAQGIDWHSIRTSAQPPFVPHLSSITDTAYFPVDELADVPEEPTPSLSTGAWHGNARSDVASPTQSEREREREKQRGKGGTRVGLMRRAMEAQDLWTTRTWTGTLRLWVTRTSATITSPVATSSERTLLCACACVRV